MNFRLVHKVHYDYKFQLQSKKVLSLRDEILPRVQFSILKMENYIGIVKMQFQGCRAIIIFFLNFIVP